MEDVKTYDRWNNKELDKNTDLNNNKFSSSFKLVVKWKRKDD